LGLLLFIQFFTRGLDIDLKSEAEGAKAAEDDEEDEDIILQKRVYQVQNLGVVEIPLREINLRNLAGAVIVTIKRDNSIQRAHADSKLQLYDHVLAEGPLANLLKLEEYLGPEVVDNDLVEREKAAATVIVTEKKAAGKSIEELKLPSKYGVMFTHFRRGPIEMAISPKVVLERGDVLTLAGDKTQLEKAIKELGHGEEKKHETDIFMFCLGLLVGVVLGTIKLPLINTSIGMAAGLLISGILVGYFRHFGYYSGRMPRAARYILQELGMLFFLATVGVQAGQGLAEQLARSGLALFVTGASVTMITLVCTLFFCRFIMKFDWNTSFGATTGGVTSTVALKMITDKAESQYALLGYAGVYAFANILLTLIGQALVLLAL
jgi:putative transport protein